MAEMNKINSFKSFTEIRNAEAQNKLREESSTKRKQLAQKFESILDEMGITSYNELDEEQQREFISRILDEDHSDNPNDKYVVKPCDEPGTPWAVWEGDVRVECFKTEEDAKSYADKQNKEQGLGEGNAFGAAVKKAKDAGEKEFEFEGKTYKVEESLVNEAIQVEGKRDAKKVATQYNKIFNKSLVDFGAMTTESILGCIKYLMNEALHDANFHKEAEPTANMIKGNIRPLEIKMPGLGGHFVKIGPKTIKEILDKYYSDIANAAGWGGIGIVEGTALYLEQIKQEAMGQAALNKFNTMFEGEEVRVDVEAKINEAKVLEAAAWEIGKDYPSYGVAVGVTQNGDVCEVSFDSGQKIVFRDTGSKWVQESVVNEGRVKQFEMDLEEMIDDIKRGYGWIDPEYVPETWNMSSDSIDFELVKGEIYKRLIASKLLAYPNDDDEDGEEAGTYVKSLKELGIKESLVTEGISKDIKTKEYKEVSNAISRARKASDIWNMLDPKMFEFEVDEFEDIFDEWWNDITTYDSIADFSKNATSEDVHSLYLHLLPYVIESVVTEGTSGRTVDSLEARKYELKKDVKGARIGDFTNVTLPKGTIIHNLPRGVFANHFSLKQKYTSKYSSQAPQWNDKFGVMVRQMPETLKDIEDNSKVLESVVTENYEVIYSDEEANEALISSDDQAYLDQITSFLKKYKDEKGLDNDKKFTAEVIKVLKQRVGDRDGLVKKRFQKILKNIEKDFRSGTYLKLNESVVNEAEINTDEEFKEYAFTVLKKAFQKDFDETKANDVVDGILSSSEGDYGVAIGMLVNSIG